MSQDQNKHKLLSDVLATIDFYRGIVLDNVEQEIGESPRWPMLRSRLLKALGDRGLVNRVKQILSTSLFELGGGE